MIAWGEYVETEGTLDEIAAGTTELADAIVQGDVSGPEPEDIFVYTDENTLGDDDDDDEPHDDVYGFVEVRTGNGGGRFGTLYLEPVCVDLC